MRDADDIETVWDAAKGGFGAADFCALIKAGVPKETLAAQLYRDLWPGALDIAIQNGKWRQMFRGHRAIVLPVPSPAGDLADLVAFRTETPKAFWCHTGGTALLGFENLRRAEHETRILREDDCPEEWLTAPWSKGLLTVHDNPMAWIIDECRGVCILEWEHYWPAYFGDVAGLRATSVSFAKKLQGALASPLRVPEIMVAA